MAALFPRWSTPVFRAAIAILLGGAAIAICAPMIYVRTRFAPDQGDPLAQPIAFDHRHHVRDDGIDCVYCHETVETDAQAGFPPTERCMGCHVQVWPDSPELAPLRASWLTRKAASSGLSGHTCTWHPMHRSVGGKPACASVSTVSWQ